MDMSEISDDEVLHYAEKLGRTPSVVFPRRAVQEVECSKCRALAGSPCHNGRGRIRTANHMERCYDRIRVYLRVQRSKMGAN